MAIINGNASNNLLFGTAADDAIYGMEGNDLLFGGQGSDDLFGGLGNDILFGGAGDDDLEGGQGNDFLVGGLGADYFVFNSNSGNDIIWDFTKGEDKIEIDPSVLPDIGAILNNVTYGNGFAQIDLGGGNNIYLNGITPNTPLTKDDFVEYKTVDFEDLNSTASGVPLPSGYMGFNWLLADGSNAYHQDDSGAGYGVMGTNLIYNAFESETVTISRVDGASFEFEGVDLISAITPSQTIEVFGYLGGVLVESETVNLTNSAVTELDLEWDEVDTVVFDTQLTANNHFAMDNFDFIL